MSSLSRRPSAEGFQILRAAARMRMLSVRRNPMMLVTSTVQPVALFVMLAAGRGSEPPSGFKSALLLEIMLTSLWGATLWTAASNLRLEISEGTLGRNLIGAADPRTVLLGKCLGSVAVVVANLTLTGLVLALCSRTTVPVRNLIPVAAVLGLAALSGVALGFALSSVFVLTRNGAYVTSVLTYPVYILAGLLVPIRFLPAPCHWLSYGISLFWANKYVEAAVSGGHLPIGSVVILLALTAFYYVAGHMLFARVLDRARNRGTIDLG